MIDQILLRKNEIQEIDNKAINEHNQFRKETTQYNNRKKSLNPCKVQHIGYGRPTRQPPLTLYVRWPILASMHPLEEIDTPPCPHIIFDQPHKFPDVFCCQRKILVFFSFQNEPMNKNNKSRRPYGIA